MYFTSGMIWAHTALTPLLPFTSKDFKIQWTHLNPVLKHELVVLFEACIFTG